jgi:hypothetical protein
MTGDAYPAARIKKGVPDDELPVRPSLVLSLEAKPLEGVILAQYTQARSAGPCTGRTYSPLIKSPTRVHLVSCRRKVT